MSCRIWGWYFGSSCSFGCSATFRHYGLHLAGIGIPCCWPLQWAKDSCSIIGFRAGSYEANWLILFLGWCWSCSGRLSIPSASLGWPCSILSCRTTSWCLRECRSTTQSFDPCSCRWQSGSRQLHCFLIRDVGWYFACFECSWCLPGVGLWFCQHANWVCSGTCRVALDNYYLSCSHQQWCLSIVSSLSSGLSLFGSTGYQDPAFGSVSKTSPWR